MRTAADIIKGKTKSPHVNAWVIPGSKSVERAAINEGLDKVFVDAGFDFRAAWMLSLFSYERR